MNEDPKIHKINITLPLEDFLARGTLDLLHATTNTKPNQPVTITLTLSETQFLEVKSQVEGEALSRENKVCSCDIMVLMAKGCQCGAK